MAPSFDSLSLEKSEEDDVHHQREKHKLAEPLESSKSKRICLRECSVLLDRLRFKEVMITAPSPRTREVFYVSTYDLNDTRGPDDSYSMSEDKYIDWRVETLEALNFRAKKKGNVKTEMEISKPEADSLKLFISFPETLDRVFSVGHASGDLHMILSILCGEAMGTPILDAYLLLRLNQYWDNVRLQQSAWMSRQKSVQLEYSLRRNGVEMESACAPTPINFQYLSFLFMPVHYRDQNPATFKVDMRHFPKVDTKVLKSCQLIAPQYNSKHFYMAVFDFPNKCVQIHDSSWHYLPLQLRIFQLKTILRALTDDPLEWTFDIVKRSSPQYDEYSCGIYTIYYAETLLKGVSAKRNLRKLPTQTVNEIRKRVVKELLKTTSLGTKILKAIT